MATGNLDPFRPPFVHDEQCAESELPIKNNVPLTARLLYNTFDKYS